MRRVALAVLALGLIPATVFAGSSFGGSRSFSPSFSPSRSFSPSPAPMRSFSPPPAPSPAPVRSFTPAPAPAPAPTPMRSSITTPPPSPTPRQWAPSPAPMSSMGGNKPAMVQSAPKTGGSFGPTSITAKVSTGPSKPAPTTFKAGPAVGSLSPGAQPGKVTHIGTSSFNGKPGYKAVGIVRPSTTGTFGNTGKFATRPVAPVIAPGQSLGPRGYGTVVTYRPVYYSSRPVRTTVYVSHGYNYPVNYYGGYSDYSYAWQQPQWYYNTPISPCFYYNPPVTYNGQMYPGSFNGLHFILSLLFFGLLLWLVVEVFKFRKRNSVSTFPPSAPGTGATL